MWPSRLHTSPPAHSYWPGAVTNDTERWRARFDDDTAGGVQRALLSDPERTFAQVLDFLELPAFTPDGSRSTTATTTGRWATRSAPGRRALPGANGGCTVVLAPTSAGPYPLMETAAAPATGDDAPARPDHPAKAGSHCRRPSPGCATSLWSWWPGSGPGTRRFSGRGPVPHPVQRRTLAPTSGCRGWCALRAPAGRDLRRGLQVSLWPVAAPAAPRRPGLRVRARAADTFSRHGENAQLTDLSVPSRCSSRLGAVATVFAATGASPPCARRCC